MKNYLILSGGAFKGSFQVGAVEYLLEKGVEFEKVFGISTGAINGSMIAQKKIVDLVNFWDQVMKNGQQEIYEPILASFENDKLKISSSKIVKTALSGFWKSLLQWSVKKNIVDNINSIDGLFNMNPLREKLMSSLTLDGFVSEYHFGVVDFNYGLYRPLTNKDFFLLDDLVDGVIASASMPIISKPISSVQTYGPEYLNVLDGGVRKSSPISDAIKSVRGDEDVHFYIINCNSGNIEVDTSKKSIGGILLRTIDIMMSQLFLQDLSTFKKINEISDGVMYKKIPYTLIETQGNILGDPLETSKIEMRYDLGRYIAKNAS